MSSPSLPADPGPDNENWFRIQETVLMLNLAVAQISHAMREGDESVNSLATSFTGMMDKLSGIRQQTAALPASPAQQTIANDCNEIRGQMQSAIVAFQFYDKLNQRLNHLSHSLEQFSSLMATQELYRDKDAWQQLQTDIKARYPVESDKALFEAILQGASVAEVLQHIHSLNRGDDDEDIELF